MGRRSNFRRRKQDAYDTPREAVVPLMDHLPARFSFAEPCAGACELAMHIDDLTESSALVTLLSDIEPRCLSVESLDALICGFPANTDFIITNPPWTRQILEPLLTHFRLMLPTWLLLPAEFAHTKYGAKHLKYCSKIVTVGRVRWISGSPHKSLDSAAWYLFGRDEVRTEFIGRTA